MRKNFCKNQKGLKSSAKHTLPSSTQIRNNCRWGNIKSLPIRLTITSVVGISSFVFAHRAAACNPINPFELSSNSSTAITINSCTDTFTIDPGVTLNVLGVAITNNSSITNLTNTGIISSTGTNARGIWTGFNSTITSLINTGTISATGTNAYGIYIGSDRSSITNLTNIGTIFAVGANSAGIYNNSHILGSQPSIICRVNLSILP
jgi:hypothetical protein